MTTIPTTSTLISFAVGMTGNEDQAKVIVETVQQRAERKKEELRTDTNIRAYLFLHVRNECLAWLNKQKKQTT